MLDVEFVTKKASIIVVLPADSETMFVEEKKEFQYLVKVEEEPNINTSWTPAALPSVVLKKVL